MSDRNRTLPLHEAALSMTWAAEHGVSHELQHLLHRLFNEDRECFDAVARVIEKRRPAPPPHTCRPLYNPAG